jgi:hypothetical protein
MTERRERALLIRLNIHSIHDRRSENEIKKDNHGAMRPDTD